MSDDEVQAAALEDPDAQPTDAAFWKDARPGLPGSGAVRLVLERDVLDWYTRQGGDYRALMEEVLRAHAAAHKAA